MKQNNSVPSSHDEIIAVSADPCDVGKIGTQNSRVQNYNNLKLKEVDPPYL